MFLVSKTICFIACHGASADHFAIFIKELEKTQIPIEVCASTAVVKKFEDREITVKRSFSLDGLSDENQELLAAELAKTCSTAAIVITDVGHRFAEKIHTHLANYADVQRWAYYDNPERYVPGGYSTTATCVMKAAQGIWFANKNLIQGPIYEAPSQEIDLSQQKKIGIGYYPIAAAEAIANRRKTEEKAILRKKLFEQFSITDTEQRVLVYFGGNNEAYFNDAFPRFLSIASQADLKNFIVLLHQHPAAKAKNRDWNAASEYPDLHLLLSEFSSDQAQVLADVAAYYQTSMGPQFVLAGIPTVQVAHETYEDVLVSNGLAPSITSVPFFQQYLDELSSKEEAPLDKAALFEQLGIRADWGEALKDLVTR